MAANSLRNLLLIQYSYPSMNVYAPSPDLCGLDLTQRLACVASAPHLRPTRSLSIHCLITFRRSLESFRGCPKDFRMSIHMVAASDSIVETGFAPHGVRMRAFRRTFYTVGGLLAILCNVQPHRTAFAPAVMHSRYVLLLRSKLYSAAKGKPCRRDVALHS